MASIWTRRGRILLGIVGLVLVSAPVFGARFLLANHTRSQAETQISQIAAETIQRAEAAIDQGLTALTDLSLLGVSKCNDRDLDLMRRAVYANFFIKEVGIVGADGQILCNHIGDVIPAKRVSHRLASRNRHVSFQLVELGESDRIGLMLLWSYGNGSGLSTIIPSQAILTNILPKNLRATAFAQIKLSDGATIGTLTPAGSTNPTPMRAEMITADIASERYPIRMQLTIPLSTFEAENASLLTYVNIGGVTLSALVFGFLLYILRGPPGAVGELGRAAARDEFIPYYQPVIDIQSGRLVGCEVLMRWRKADGSIVAPSAFIRLAEASGLAEPMTLSLMRQARDDLNDAFGQRPQLKISINMFEGHFASLKTISDVDSIFRGAGIAFSQLIFEVTERQPLADIKQAQLVIKRLQELGSRVALDDAGTGHAGLAYLQQLGVDVIKIDKFFIDTITKNGGPVPIVDSLVKLGHDLGMEVVAEGVETFAQLEYLRARGADSAQGYLFSPPIPVSAFLELVEAMEPLSRPRLERGFRDQAPILPTAKVA